MNGHKKSRRVIVAALATVALSVAACGRGSDDTVRTAAAEAPAAVEHRLAGLSPDAADRWSTNNRLVGLSADAAGRWSTNNRLAGFSADAAEQWG
jgi:hypothetical protein